MNAGCKSAYRAGPITLAPVTLHNNRFARKNKNFAIQVSGRHIRDPV